MARPGGLPALSLRDGWTCPTPRGGGEPGRGGWGARGQLAAVIALACALSSWAAAFVVLLGSLSQMMR
jgi:hypothetical protein